MKKLISITLVAVAILTALPTPAQAWKGRKHCSKEVVYRDYYERPVYRSSYYNDSCDYPVRSRYYSDDSYDYPVRARYYRDDDYYPRHTYYRRPSIGLLSFFFGR